MKEKLSGMNTYLIAKPVIKTGSISVLYLVLFIVLYTVEYPIYRSMKFKNIFSFIGIKLNTGFIIHEIPKVIRKVFPKYVSVFVEIIFLIVLLPLTIILLRNKGVINNKLIKNALNRRTRQEKGKRW